MRYPNLTIATTHHRPRPTAAVSAVPSSGGCKRGAAGGGGSDLRAAGACTGRDRALDGHCDGDGGLPAGPGLFGPGDGDRPDAAPSRLLLYLCVYVRLEWLEC